MKVETDCFYLILLVGFYFLKKFLYFHHSHLYNLSESQVIHIFKTFHKDWNYNYRLKKVLKYYKLWENNF